MSHGFGGWVTAEEANICTVHVPKIYEKFSHIKKYTAP